MLNDLNPKDYRNIYIVCGFTDMRGGINTLSSIIEGRYKMNAFIGKTLFLFCGRKANTIKALTYDESLNPCKQLKYAILGIIV